MTMSHFFSASMSCASLRVVSFFACAGALPPALEVEKNTGSMRPKSAFGLHAVHQDRTHHAAPTDEAYEISNLAHHYRPFRKVIWFPRLVWAGEGARRTGAVLALGNGFAVMAATTASPISRVPTLRGAFRPDVRRAQPRREHVLDRTTRSGRRLGVG
jgi:hypothetical protein